MFKLQLTHIEEAFTSEHWLVRIYKVKENPKAGQKKGGKIKLKKKQKSG